MGIRAGLLGNPLGGGVRMKSMRDRYFENFDKIQTPADNRRGFKTEYRYKSDFYAWDLDPAALKRERVLFAAAEAVSVVLFLVSASQKTAFNTTRLAIGFAILSVVPYIAELWGAFKLAAAKQPMMIPDFNEIRSCIQIGAVFRILLLAAAVATGVLSLIRGGQMDMANLLVILGHAATGALSGFVFYRYNRLSYRILRNVNGKPGAER